MRYGVPLGSCKWAKYVDRNVESQASFTKKALECLPNRLTPLYYGPYIQGSTGTKRELVLD